MKISSGHSERMSRRGERTNDVKSVGGSRGRLGRCEEKFFRDPKGLAVLQEADQEDMSAKARSGDAEEIFADLDVHLRFPRNVQRDLRESNDLVEIRRLESSEGVSSSVVSEVVPILPTRSEKKNGICQKESREEREERKERKTYLM